MLISGHAYHSTMLNLRLKNFSRKPPLLNLKRRDLVKSGEIKPQPNKDYRKHKVNSNALIKEALYLSGIVIAIAYMSYLFIG